MMTLLAVVQLRCQVSVSSEGADSGVGSIHESSTIDVGENSQIDISSENSIQIWILPSRGKLKKVTQILLKRS